MRNTNYNNTFIAVAEDCKKSTGTIPPKKTPPTVAQLTYDIISQNPYKYTSNEILLEIHRQRNEGATLQDYSRNRQACFRCSPLSKTYGWGFHFDTHWKVAIYCLASQQYQQFLNDSGVKQKTAFSSKR
jgi:hypothetical protein